MTTQTGFPVGGILAFAGAASSIPADWLPCDGSAIPAQYTALLDLFGVSEGLTPNLIGRTLIGAGTLGAAKIEQDDGLDPGFGNLGGDLIVNATGGECFHQLTEDELPSHTHSINGGDFGRHTQSFTGDSGSDLPFETGGEPDKFVSLGGTDPDGDDQPHNNMQPYYVVTYIIYAGQPAQT